MELEKPPFKVFGSEPGGLVHFDIEDAVVAVQTATRMIEAGFKQIYILDKDGKVYRPTVFHLLVAT